MTEVTIDHAVSLTSVCCKILESIIRDNMMHYLLHNTLISNNQYGFIKNRSTSLQLTYYGYWINGQSTLSMGGK